MSSVDLHYTASSEDRANVEVCQVGAGVTLDPEPSQTPPCCVELQPEPATTDEPLPLGVTVLRIVLEPEPKPMSDQMHEPTAMHTTVDETVEHEDTKEALPTVPLLREAICELSVCPELSACLGLPVCPVMTMKVCNELFVCPELSVTPVVPLSEALPMLGVTIWCVSAAYTIPETPDCHELPPSLPLPPPLMSSLQSSALLLLHPASPSALPQLAICGADSLRVCQFPASPWSEDLLSPLPASEIRTTLQPADTSAPPWLTPLSSPQLSISLPALPGSLVPPALPWPIVIHLPPLALSGSPI
ncbi:Multimerin-1 [Labeo rohita]|uniref:Multimerin-1 n=1 Tax=Labeo rohita TaxID=84645 RepID=A0ABQ8L8P9_LABRO|nr:Multimerin-1 [Labeo rohita]